MQKGLFDISPTIDFNVDPYAAKREAGCRLAGEFLIEDREGFELVLGFGSEDGARRVLVQRWYRGEVELRPQAA